MSMIDVQGARSKDKDASAQGRDRYEDKTDARGLSHIPFYAGAAISALMIYLKESLAKPEPLYTPAAEEPRHRAPGSEEAQAGDDEVSPDDVAAAQSPWFYMGTESENQLSGGSGGGSGGSSGPQLLPALSVTHSGWFMGTRYPQDSLDTQFQPTQQYGAGHGDMPMTFPAVAGNDNGMAPPPSRRVAADADERSVGSVGGSSGHSVHGEAPRLNHAPKVTGRVKLADEFTNVNFAILTATLLGKATDEDGDRLSVKDVRANGVLLTQSNGQYTYQGDKVGPVVITYLVTDGLTSVMGVADVVLKQKPVTAGTDGDDLLQGTTGDDILNGGKGKDQIDGQAGHDVIDGGEGDDVIMGGDGRDYIHDGAGKDIILGGAGNDTIFGSEDGANDIFDGGLGSNILSYASSTHSIVFDLGRGIASGVGIGHDQIKNFQVFEAGSADDTFLTTLSLSTGVPAAHKHPTPPVALPSNTDAGTDAGTGSGTGSGTGTGQSTSIALPSTANDATPAAASTPPVVHADQHNTYLGGDGTDTLDYSGATKTITVDLRHGTVQGAELGTDFVSSIEHFITGSGDDKFIAAGAFDPHHMTIADNTGKNAIDLSDKSHDAVSGAGSGAGANQQFCGGGGSDTLDYSEATHAVTINTETGIATGQDIGIDHFDGIEHFIGGVGDDTFVIGAGTVVVDGNGGADVFQFTAPTADSGPALTIAHIEGFEVGDLVRMSMYDLFDQVDPAQQDPFQNVYSNQQNATGGSPAEPDLIVPIRVRIDTLDDHQTTYIDADLDNNGSYEITVQLDGNHHLTIINNHIA